MLKNLKLSAVYRLVCAGAEFKTSTCFKKQGREKITVWLPYNKKPIVLFYLCLCAFGQTIYEASVGGFHGRILALCNNIGQKDLLKR